MSILSANTLFHFTKLEFLEQILEHGFWPRYSEEILFDGIANEEGFRMHVPMVCFCDIPLTRIEKHQEVYSNYGIGLTKEWGIANQLNPVFYVQHEAPPVTGALLYIFLAFFNRILGNKKFKLDLKNMLDKDKAPTLPVNIEVETITKDVESNPYLSYFFNFLKLGYLPYIKAFKGNSFRGISDYSYYDEKEWRFIPSLDVEKIIEFGFESDTELELANELLKVNMLTFKPNDIKYLILENENEIESLREALKSIHGRTGKYPTEVVDVLTARIITCKQIREDF